MADYWISRDKYFCKYCNIYIADDKPVRPLLSVIHCLR